MNLEENFEFPLEADRGGIQRRSRILRGRHQFLSNRIDNVLRNHKKTITVASSSHAPSTKELTSSKELKYQAEIDNLKEELKKRYQSIVTLEAALEAQRDTMRIMSNMESKYQSEIDDLKLELEKRSDSMASLEKTLASQRDTIRQLRKEGSKPRNGKRDEFYTNKKGKQDRNRKHQQNDCKNMGDSSRNLSSNPDQLLRASLGEENFPKDKRRNYHEKEKKKVRSVNRSNSEPRMRSDIYTESSRTKTHRSTRIEEGKREESSSSQLRIRRMHRSKDSSKSLLQRTAPSSRALLRKQLSLPSSLQSKYKDRFDDDEFPLSKKQTSVFPTDSATSSRRCNNAVQAVETNSRRHQDTKDQAEPSFSSDNLNSNINSLKQSMPANDVIEQAPDVANYGKPPKPSYTPSAPIISNIANMSKKKSSMLRKADGSVSTNPSNASSKTPTDVGMPILSSQPSPRLENSAEFGTGAPTQLISVASNTFIEKTIALRQDAY